MSLERIDKILSHEGFGTRKDVKRLLRFSSVTVNGTQITAPDFHCDVDNDEICVDGKVLSLQHNIYLMMNKPQDVVCANKDGLHNTVFSLLDEQYKSGFALEKLHLIGRLDIDTEGLLIFTTDGKLTHKLISPKSNCPKKYFVRLSKSIDEKEYAEYETELKKGIHIAREDNEDEADCLPAEIQFTEKNDEVFLTIVEGKYHQVKRMFKALGNCVEFLKRVSINGLFLDENLLPGQYRRMTDGEVSLLVHNL
ncbi:MAG: pseudouridine synthase [Spirochaetia bacterium]|nr:pseudouridine synthase [Spirochaetia bacterium]